MNHNVYNVDMNRNNVLSDESVNAIINDSLTDNGFTLSSQIIDHYKHDANINYNNAFSTTESMMKPFGNSCISLSVQGFSYMEEFVFVGNHTNKNESYKNTINAVNRLSEQRMFNISNQTSSTTVEKDVIVSETETTSAVIVKTI